MPSTFSSNLRLELMATGENTATWGTKANNVFELIEDAISGYLSIAMADANLTLTTVNGATDQARRMILDFTGTLTAIRTITIPTTGKVYFMRNSTTGGFALNVKTSAGNTLTINNGNSIVFFCDGTNCVKSFEVDAEKITTGTLAIANGGTDASTASTARANLGTDNASNLTSGTVADARLPTSMAGKTFTSSTTVSAGSLSITGANQGIEIGPSGTSNTPFVDFHSGATGVDYDARLIASGGTGVVGNGTLNIISGALQHNGVDVVTGSVAAFPAGTIMLFQQTAAPTGWTKITTHNNKALRVVSGTVTSGGTVAFTTAFASQSVAGTVNSTTAGGTVGSHALTTAELPSHSHTSGTLGGTATSAGSHDHDILEAVATGGTSTRCLKVGTTINADSSDIVTRDIMNDAGAHTHSVDVNTGSTGSAGSGSGHTHTFTGTSHNHTFSGTAINLDVQHVDIIFASKN